MIFPWSSRTGNVLLLRIVRKQCQYSSAGAKFDVIGAVFVWFDAQNLRVKGGEPVDIRSDQTGIDQDWRSVGRRHTSAD